MHSPGQKCVLQVLFCTEEPSHCLPPYLSISLSLALNWIPPPHEALHSVHSFQGSHAQSTAQDTHTHTRTMSVCRETVVYETWLTRTMPGEAKLALCGLADAVPPTIHGDWLSAGPHSVLRAIATSCAALCPLSPPRPASIHCTQ